MQSYLWSKLGVRFTHVKANPGFPFHWLFLPGGPGMGSEYLYELTRHLRVPGNLWHLDLPGDGSNRFEGRQKPFESWLDALSEAIDLLSNVMLVGHSTGGMLALSSPDIEDKLKGLVLISSAPDRSWRVEFENYVSRNPIRATESLFKRYYREPSDSLLRTITLKCIPYSFTKAGMSKDLKWLKDLPYNSAAYQWAERNFDSTYSAKWKPRKIPALILSGSEDKITPLKCFSELTEYQKPYIQLTEISKAGHFPWIENLNETCQSFMSFAETVSENGHKPKIYKIPVISK